MKQLCKSLVLASSLMIAGSASAATITSLYDDFESEGIATNQDGLSLYELKQWTATDVDLAITPHWGAECSGNTGACIDLDGSNQDFSSMTTKDSFAAGKYEISFELSGNQRSKFLSNNDDAIVKFGSLNLKINDLAWNADWKTYSFLAVVAEGDKLTFATSSNDNHSYMLDNVSVSSVPVPAAAFLFTPVLMGFVGLRRKAAKKA